MRKLFAIVLSAAILSLSFSGVVMAEEIEPTADAAAEVVADPDLQEAKEVTKLLTEKELFPDKTITRAAFVTAMLEFMQIETRIYSDCFFSDVKFFEEYAPAVYTAVDMGWISRGEEFEPTREISPNEALKIIIRMLGYELMSQNKGGYPAGDLYVARNLDLLDGVDMSSGILSSDAAYMLLFNASMVPTFEQVIYGKEEKYKETGDSLLKSVYDIDVIEGIINRTPYNTLSGAESVGKGDRVEMDGVSYKGTEISWEMLGVRSRAFVKEGPSGSRSEIVYARDLSERKTISLRDIDKKEENQIFYWNGDSAKTRSVKLSPSCQVILNGRKAVSELEECFAYGAGEVVLADNDEDGLYDVAFVNRYDYATALSYDSVTETFRDKYTSKSTVSFEQSAVILRDETGEELNPLDIGEDDTFRMIKSRDGGFIYMQKLAGTVSGMVNKMSVAEKKMTIDGIEYTISEYFIENFANQVKPPSEGSFIIDDNVIISAVVSGSEMRYGYLVGCAWSGSFKSSLKMRIYTQSGKFEEFDVKEKVVLDGENGCTGAQVYAALTSGGALVPQLIKYAVSGDGKINTIDTAATELPKEPGVYEDSRNSLTKYKNLSKNLPYSGNSQAMGALYSVAGSVVFCIPPDLTQEDDFQIRGLDFFVHDRTYALEVYDIDKTGVAGVLVYRGADSYFVHADNPSMIVKEVRTALNEEGDFIYEIHGWRNGAFITVTLDSDFEVKKLSAAGVPVNSTHDILSGGDIIGYAADADGEIKALNVIYDGRQGVMANNNAIFNSDQRAAPMYYEGMVYDVNGSYAAISIVKTADGYDFSQDSLRYIKLAGNFASYNAKTGEIRPLSASDIKTYKADGKNAHYGVFCLSNFALKTAIFYEDMEARK